MGSGHNCDHHRDHDAVATNKVFKIGIALNLFFVVIEIYFGLVHNSLALVSDAVHNLTDVFGLLVAWLGFVLSKNARTKKFSIYAALINTTLLIAGSVWLIAEAYHRFYSGQEPVALTMMIVAFVGFIINFVSARMFGHSHQEDLNMKSAYLHLMADAAISLGVVLAGAVIYFTSLYWVDPATSALISVIIIFSTWGVFKEAVIMLLGRPPSSVNMEKLKSLLEQEFADSEIVEIKVWALSTSENALKARIRGTEGDSERLKHQLGHEFKMTLIVFEFH